jgi:hypothetical protein
MFKILWVELLRLKSIEMCSYTSTFPCACMVCRWTAVPSASPVTHIPFHLNAIQNKELKLQRKARLGKLKWVHNPQSCFHHHHVIINNSSSSISNLRHGRPSPHTTVHRPRLTLPNVIQCLSKF